MANRRPRTRATASRSIRSTLRAALSGALALGVAAATLFAAAPANAAPEYEITTRWVEGTPTTVRTGDVVTAEWRVNVNDDAAAPSNEPVENVNFTLTIANGVFTSLPDGCVVDGADPASSISADGRTLVCNIGTQDQGTAHVLQTAISVDGPTGSQLTGTGAIDGATAELSPIDILNEFGMDIAWGTPTPAGVATAGLGYVDVDFQWTLFVDDAMEAGPDSVSYTIDLRVDNGSASSVAPAGCGPFTTGGAPAHPWSGGSHPTEQLAPSVVCSLTPTGVPNQYTLTLTGIDYSLTQVPTLDSMGNPMRQDASAVASGQVVFRIATTTNTGVSLTTDAPMYVAPGSGTTSQDLPDNNTSSKAIMFPGSYSAGYDRTYTRSGGSVWDDAYRLSRGAVVLQSGTIDTQNRVLQVADPNALYGYCQVLDSRYVTFVDAAPGGAGIPASTLQYYVGDSPLVDGASATYDPSAFSCGTGGYSLTGGNGWVTERPADLSTVKAVRTIYPLSMALESIDREAIFVYSQVKDDVATGQDIWMFGAPIINSNQPSYNTAGNRVTDTPGARYPYTTALRDLFRIVDATPAVEKTADRTVLQPGEAATYTLTYSANGEGGIPETVDGFTVADTLPIGLTYVDGSATPAPSVSTDLEGRQVLSWAFDGVATNTPHTVTYQAIADASVTPGQALTNIVWVAYGGNTSSDTAQVTVSTSGYTSIGKTADSPFIPNLDGKGIGEGSWTVTLRSFDPRPQAFTDTIDILPYEGDQRGTDFEGTYALTDVEPAPGATVYYTTADPASLSDDPADAANGAAGDVAGNTVGWSTDFTAEATAVRVIGPALAPGATQQFTVHIATNGVEGGDLLVNRAQARDGNTELVMRTSAPITVANYYSAALKKYVQGTDGRWHDANTVEDYPKFKVGDTINYRIEIRNTGQGTLTNVVISDDKQPELGRFVIESLAPGAVQERTYSIVADPSMGDGVVNTASATADTPPDSGVPPEIPSDPAGFEVEGEPTHVKSLLSATPTGNGQWRLVYGIDVTNVSTASTSYTLDDTLRFTEHAEVASAEVTMAPPGVTLADPAWNGEGNTRIATNVPLAGNDDAGYAPHHYEVTVVADVPLQIPGAGSGAADPTQCGPDGDDANRAFNNTSQLTDAMGGIEDDQACAPIPSIDITKGVSAGPTPNGDGTWTVTYDIVATNTGAADGVYEVTDRMTADGDLTVVSGEVVTAPAEVTPSPDWTGLGIEGAPENVIASGVTLPAGGAHTYQVEVVLGIDPSVEGIPVITACQPDGSAPGGLANSAGIEHNDLPDAAVACITVAFITIDKTISSGPTPNGDGTYTIVYDLDVENVGSAAGDYDLRDMLRYGEGIEIDSAEVVTTPTGVTAEASWTGEGAALTDAENLIAGGITLGAGSSHTYQVEVVVQMDEATIDPGALQCPPPGSGDGGLANSASVTHNGIVGTDEVCASLPLLRIDKSISAGPTANGDGTWTITYDLVVTNEGEAAGEYELTDELQYGDGVSVVSAAVVTAPGEVEPNSGWTGQGEPGSDVNLIAGGVALDVAATHTYQVQVRVSLDQASVTPDTLACTPGEAGGLANTAELTHNGETQSDDECASLPLIDIVKSIAGAIAPVDGAPGQYDVTYELTVTNRGPAAGSYDLDDQLEPGDGVEIVGVQSVTTDAPESVGLDEGFDGVGVTRIVTAQPIAGAAPGVPVVHTYTVVVRYSADLAGIDVPAADQCTDASGAARPGTLNNTATVGWNGIVGSDDECVVPGKPTLDKALVSAAPAGGGQWDVVYDLTVGNTGDEATVYDLDDEFLFAPTVTVDTVAVAGPDGVELNPGFDGDATTRIATGVSIIGLDDAGYAPHVYTVTVTVNVPLTFPAAEADGTGAPGCTVPAGGNLIEQGLNNAATLTDENGNEQTDTDCAPLPAFTIDKAITGAPSLNGDEVTTTYDIVVTNTGAAAGDYVLRDQLRYGTGLTVETVTAANTVPGGIPVLAGYTGQGADLADSANQVTDPVELAAGGSHTYRVIVTATVTDGATAATGTCAENDGPGGVRNLAVIDHNGLTADDTVCASFEIPGAPAGPDLASTGVAIGGLVGGAAVLLLVGAAILIARRRQEATR